MTLRRHLPITLQIPVLKEMNELSNSQKESYRLHGGRIWEIARENRIDPKEILDFSANINPLGPSPRAISAIRENLWRIPHYPEANSATLRQRIAEEYSTTLDNIIMGNGSTEIIHLFAESNIGENSKVIIPQPTFAEYEAATRRFGGRPKFIVAISDTLGLPIEQVLKETSPDTQAVFICNPNNPTGELIQKNRILEIVEKAEQEDIKVLVDETFIEFSEEHETLIHLASKFTNLMVVRSFTKIFALAGLRIGFGVGYKSLVEEIMRRKVPWNINCLAEAAVLASFNDKDYIRKSKITIRRERKYLQEQLSEMPGLTPFPTQTNFLLISTEKTGKTSHEIQNSLLRRGVIVRDCSSFRGLGDFFIRVAIRQREQNNRLIKALSETLK